MIRATAFLLFMCLPNLCSAQPPSPWGDDLLLWAGKASYSTQNTIQGIFEYPELHDGLSKIISRDKIDLMREVLTTDAAVNVLDGYLLIDGCMPHACGSDYFTVVVNLYTPDIFVFITEDNVEYDKSYNYLRGAISFKAYGTKDMRVLPREITAHVFRAG